VRISVGLFAELWPLCQHLGVATLKFLVLIIVGGRFFISSSSMILIDAVCTIDALTQIDHAGGILMNQKLRSPCSKSKTGDEDVKIHRAFSWIPNRCTSACLASNVVEPTGLVVMAVSIIVAAYVCRVSSLMKKQWTYRQTTSLQYWEF